MEVWKRKSSSDVLKEVRHRDIVERIREPYRQIHRDLLEDVLWNEEYRAGWLELTWRKLEKGYGPTTARRRDGKGARTRRTKN
jgi:hypothetical protein